MRAHPLILTAVILLSIPLFAQNQNNELGLAIGTADMGDFGFRC